MGHAPGRWLADRVVAARITAAEREKRARLRAEIEELRRPAFGVTLPREEKRAIALRVRSGKIAQALFPAAAGSYARGKN